MHSSGYLSVSSSIVGNYKVVELSALKLMCDILEECAAYGLVNGVEQNRFFIAKKIRVVGNAVGNSIDALKAGETAVVCTDPDKVGSHISCAVHNKPPDLHNNYIIIVHDAQKNNCGKCHTIVI